RTRRGRRSAGPPARPRAPALERRHELHDRDRGRPRAAREPPRRLRQVESGVGGLASQGVTDGAHDGDHLPEDLDVTAYVGPYVFPDIRRRRIAGTLYAVLGLGLLWAAFASANGGLLLGAILLLAIAAYHFVAGWPLAVDQ